MTTPSPAAHSCNQFIETHPVASIFVPMHWPPLLTPLHGVGTGVVCGVA